MKRHVDDTPGPKRAERLEAEAAARRRYPERVRQARTAAVLRGMWRNAVGIKRWFVPGSEFEGKGQLTPYARKELRRRRRAGRTAKQARKVNRG